MATSAPYPAAVAALLLLSACGDGTAPGAAADLARPGTAEEACVQAVTVNGAAGRPSVVSSEVSGREAVILLQSGRGTVWRCSVAGNVVTDLTIV